MSREETMPQMTMAPIMHLQMEFYREAALKGEMDHWPTLKALILKLTEPSQVRKDKTKKLPTPS